MDLKELEKVSDFTLGEENTRLAPYFTGKSYLSLLNNKEVEISNVTFEPEIKHWHGAVSNEAFSNLSLSLPIRCSYTKWCEPVTDKEYKRLRYRIVKNKKNSIYKWWSKDDTL